MNKQYIFRFNTDRCIGCYACGIACKQWHNIKAGTVNLRRVEEKTAGTFPRVKLSFRSITCLHCIKPRCIEVCPAGAISKRTEDGIVVVDRDKCTGCRACYEVCPVKAPQFIDGGTMQKCDMCLERIENGQAPVCAATCPTQALRWGTLEDFAQAPM